MQLRLATLALVTLAVAACDTSLAPAPEAELRPDTARVGKADDLDATITDGVVTTAEWRDLVVGTPTYGDPATEPFLRLEVVVDDAAVAAQVGGFDGLEQVFALVPRRLGDGSLRWESVDVPFVGPELSGYYGEVRRDRHETEWLRGLDVATARELGVAFGMDTNVGTVWLQGPDENTPVLPAE